MYKKKSNRAKRLFLGWMLFCVWYSLTGAAGGRAGCIGFNLEEGCTVGESRSCFHGPAAQKDVGMCKSGTQTCTEERIWSPCNGQVLPKEKDSCNGTDDNCDGIAASSTLAETCNGADDDCDGKIDEGETLCGAGKTCGGVRGCQGQTTGPTTLFKGPFQSSAHPTQGEGQIIKDGEKLFVELSEAFKTDQGPDLKVYLTSDAVGNASQGTYLSLGPLTSVSGKQRYPITLPAGQTIEQYKSISIWCEAFSVVFGYATLKP